MSAVRGSKIHNDLLNTQLMIEDQSPALSWTTATSRSQNQKLHQQALVALDCQSKMLLVLPLPSKGSNLRGQAEQLVRFSMTLNYMDNVELVSDAEPTMKSLLASVQLMRQHLGCATTVTHSRLGDKGCTSQVERPSKAEQHFGSYGK